MSVFVLWSPVFYYHVNDDFKEETYLSYFIVLIILELIYQIHGPSLSYKFSCKKSLTSKISANSAYNDDVSCLCCPEPGIAREIAPA